MNVLVKSLKSHLIKNPQITSENYCNINPYFGRYKANGNVVDKLYIGYDYIVNLYEGYILLENNETGKITKRKL